MEHRQYLVVKILKGTLQESLQFINTVNQIDNNALNIWQIFAQFCEVNDKNFFRLLLNTELRWQSQGLYLSWCQYCGIQANYFYTYCMRISKKKYLNYQYREPTQK